MKPSTRTNAIREVFRFVAATLEEWAECGSVSEEIGNSDKDGFDLGLNVTPPRAAALRALAKELRERAVGHRGRRE